MSNTINIIQTMLPSFYKKYAEDKSVLYAVISAFGNNIDYQSNVIDRMDRMIGIDTTDDIDLEYRWGELLNCYKNAEETFDSYRTRLKLIYVSLFGGTADAIKKSVAYSIGLTDNDGIDKFIKVYDGWEYDGDVTIDDKYKTNGNVICVIDISLIQYTDNMEDKIIDKIDNIKAAGVNIYIIFTYGALYDAMDLFIDESFSDTVIYLMNKLNAFDFTLNDSFKLNYEIE